MSSRSVGQLARKVAAQPYRRVQEGGAHQEHDQAQPGIVVAAERFHALEPAEGAVELVGVVGEGPPLRRAQPGRVERLDQRPSGCAHVFHSSQRAGRRGGGAHGQRPAEDRHGGGDGAETDQDEENSLSEGEAHRP
jgi:hypothetical protein